MKNVPEKVGAAGEPAIAAKGTLQSVEANLQLLRAVFENEVDSFSRISMGARLFTIGLSILALDIIVRLIQWLGRGLSIGGYIVFNELPDDLFFISLLVVSSIMMIGGLCANIYLIWSIQRERQEHTSLVMEALETDARIEELKLKQNPD